MKEKIEIFRQFVRSKGLRNTPERETIIREIFSTPEHFDVDELYLRLAEKKKKISKPAIYRLIPLLLEAGLIQEAYFEEGHLHYEHILGRQRHCHLRCLNCGETIEFTEALLQKLEGKLAKQYGFAVEGHKLEVLGYCPNCQPTP